MTRLRDNERLQKEVIDTYDSLATRLYTWDNPVYLIPKLLSDYTLLSKIDIKDKEVLNIGCFLPVDELQLAKLVKQWVAVDLSQVAIKAAEKIIQEQLPLAIGKRVKFYVADARQLPFEDESFDVSLCFSTIDHIPGANNRQKVVNEMARVTRKGGHVVITVPNKLSFPSYYFDRKRLREGKCEYTYAHWFSPWELRQMLAISDLKIIDCASNAFNPDSYFDLLLRKLRISKLKIYFGARFGYLAQKLT